MPSPPLPPYHLFPSPPSLQPLLPQFSMGGAPSKWITSLMPCTRAEKPRTEKNVGTGKATWTLWRPFSGASRRKREQLDASGGSTTCSSANGPFSGAMAAVVRAPLKDFRALQREWAAVRIQAVFRSFLARKAYGALRAIVKIQAIFRGQQVRKQAAITLGCMEALVRAQSRARALQERVRNGEQKSKKPWETRLMKEQRDFKEDSFAKACEDCGKTKHGACRARRISTGQLSNNSSSGCPPTPTSEFYYPESSPSSSVFTSTSVSGPPPASSEGRTSVRYIGSPSYMNMTESAKARQKTRFNRSQRNSMDEFQFFKKHGFAFGELGAAGSDHFA